MAEKKKIWYARSYRTLESDYHSAIWFILLIVVPALLLVVLNLGHITSFLAGLAQQLINAELPGEPIAVETSSFVPFGQISVVAFDCALPTPRAFSLNLAVSLAVVAVMILCKACGSGTSHVQHLFSLSGGIQPRGGFADCPVQLRTDRMSRDNLLREGRKPESLYVTGNTVIDAMKHTIREDYTHPELEWVGDNKLIFITAHGGKILASRCIICSVPFAGCSMNIRTAGQSIRFT